MAPATGLIAAVAGLLLLVSGSVKPAQAADTRAGKHVGDTPGTLKPEQFNMGAGITNKWMPMKPGTRWIYEGTSLEDDGKAVPHRIEITTTDLTKAVGGVCATVSYDIDYTDNELVEAELAFYAQDKNGNVWLLGEYPEEYEDGKFVKALAWLHGQRGAKAGIMMQADPRPGTPSYSQGWAPAVGWKDRGETYLMHQTVTVPAGSFDDVLVVKESARAEPDAEQLKYYAVGTGNVRVGWTGSKKVREVLDLIKVEQLDGAAVADIRAKALALEKNAYAHSRNVFGRTKPATCNSKCGSDPPQFEAADGTCASRVQAGR